MLTPTNSLADKQPTPDQLCRIEGSLAAVVMRMRQTGARMSDLIEQIKVAPGGSRELVLKAYKYPRYSTHSMQDQAVKNFQNEIELGCFSS